MKCFFIDLPLVSSVNLDGSMIESKYGYVCCQKDIEILDAWYNLKDGEPTPQIIKDLFPKD
jgi:hypothetical protein